MLKLQLCLSLVALCQGEGLAESDPDSQFEYGIFGTPSLGTPSLGTDSLGTHSQVHRAIQRECKVEMVTIVRTNCKVEYEEEEVEECKPVHYIPRSGLGGYANLPTKLESECEKVMKMVCKDVPKKEEVMKEVEICVKTPKESCEESEQLAPSTTCE